MKEDFGTSIFLIIVRYAIIISLFLVFVYSLHKKMSKKIPFFVKIIFWFLSIAFLLYFFCMLIIAMPWDPPSRNARMCGNLSQIRTLAELTNDDKGSYASICASSTELEVSDTKYATELGIIQDDIIDQGSIVACYAGTDDYCISVLLLDPDFKNNYYYYCIDSNGIIKATNTACSSADTGCNGQSL